MTESRSRRKPQLSTIRPLEPRDREAVRDICCKTAFRNMGSDRFFEDREVHADYWTRYYTDFRPWESWVVEQDGEVIGYFFGCSDQAHFIRTMTLRILPSCLRRVLWRLARGQYKRAETRRYIRHMLLKGPKEATRIDYARFPAHYHCNILRKGYGQGYYTRLTLMYLDMLETKGITRLHGHITEPIESGIWYNFARRFEAASADVTDEVPTTLFAEVIGDDRPMVNRVWGVTVANYRVWIEWLRDRYNL
jgi:hypothetical protein